MTHLYDLKCPECKETCWVNNGDCTDQTVADVETVECWSCGHIFGVDKEVEIDPDMAEPTFKTANHAAKYSNSED